MEKTYSLSETKIKLNRLIENILKQEDEFIITKNGHPAAALVPLSLYEGWKETQAIRSDQELMDEIAEGLKRLRRKEKRYNFKEVFGESLS